MLKGDPSEATAQLGTEQAILRSLRRIMRAIDVQSRWLVSECGLSLPQMICMQVLAEESHVTASTLAQAMGISQPTVTGIIDRLEKRGLVARARDEVDRRRVFVHITGEGRQLLASAPPPLQQRFRDRLASLSADELAMIATGLDRVAQLMDTEEIDEDTLHGTVEGDGPPLHSAVSHRVRSTPGPHADS